MVRQTLQLGEGKALWHIYRYGFSKAFTVKMLAVVQSQINFICLYYCLYDYVIIQCLTPYLRFTFNISKPNKMLL